VTVKRTSKGGEEGYRASARPSLLHSRDPRIAGWPGGWARRWPLTSTPRSQDVTSRPRVAARGPLTTHHPCC